MASATAEEAVLVTRALAKDREAYGTLVSRYRDSLERILLPIAGDRERARDLVSDTVLRAYKNLARYRQGYRFSTWFFRIGINLAISAKRRERLDKKARHILREQAKESKEPLDLLQAEEEQARLKQAVSHLPDRYRRILALRYGSELGCKEIAERLHTTANSVSIVLFRAKERLRKELGIS